MGTNAPDAMATIADELLTAAELVRGQQLTAVPFEVSAGEAYAQLDAAGFDVAPITSVPIRQYVRRDELVGGQDKPVGAFARDISDAERLPERTPLSETLRALKHQPYLFVHHRDHVTGLITHADIGQQPVNLLVLGTVLSLESALDVLIQREAPREQWFDLWNQRGAERSAEVMMWGLLDVDIPLSRLGSPACGDLEQEFRFLTGVDPPGARCRS